MKGQPLIIKDLTELLGYEAITMPCPDAEVTGGYTGDLLSWVMTRVSAGNVWVTIMTNSNIVAVATLVGVSAVIIAEDLPLPQSVVELAKTHKINVLRSKKPAFETCSELFEALGLRGN